MRRIGIVLLSSCALAFGWQQVDRPTPQPVQAPPTTPPKPTTPKSPSTPEGVVLESSGLPRPRPIPQSVSRGIAWLIAAQHGNGGWGAGSSANQNLRDPHGVVVDPATTSFVASALLRAGHTPTTGAHSSAIRQATRYLCAIVEKADPNGPRITDLAGTQPQAKLGPLIDTTMTAQYLARVLPVIPPTDPLHARVDKALTRCIHKLESNQAADGSWNVAGGWAPVLQSSLGMTALELAAAAGKDVNGEALDRARGYQKGNFDEKSGRINAADGAGVALYAFAGAQRANAVEARQAREIVNKAKAEGKLDKAAEVDEDTLAQLGIRRDEARKLALAAEAIGAAAPMAGDDKLLSGFGSNGGEEFLSYLLTSEAMIITDIESWTEWNGKMSRRLEKIQSQDGSWTGHHCITSPVFCTAAVVQCMTTDRDGVRLLEMAERATASSNGGM